MVINSAPQTSVVARDAAAAGRTGTLSGSRPPSVADARETPRQRPNGASRRLRFVSTVVEASAALILFDIVASMGFKSTHRLTRRWPTFRRRATPETISQVCVCVEEACVWYWKRVFCLQRSAVATWMLRRRGIPAELVIGYRPVPVDSHAWVEVDNKVVNDRPQYQKFFKVLERL
jgi:hypothetical protein